MSKPHMSEVRKLDLGKGSRSRGAKQVLMRLAFYADEEYGLCSPTMSILADDTGYSLRHVRRIVQVLMAWGFIEVRASSRGGPGNGTEYALTLANGDITSWLETPNSDKMSGLGNGLTGTPRPSNRDMVSLNHDIVSPSLTVKEIKREEDDSNHRSLSKKISPSSIAPPPGSALPPSPNGRANGASSSWLSPLRRSGQGNANGPPRASPLPQSDYLCRVVADFSLELGDKAHEAQNISQALRLWGVSGRNEGEFAEMLQAARKRVREYQGKQGLGTINNKMAYFFRVLSNMVEEEVTDP